MNMMKSIPLAVFTIASITVWDSASAQAIKTEYQGREFFVESVAPGKQWVTADGIVHVRNAQTHYRDETSDPRISGELLITVRGNFRLAPPPVMFYGPMGGKMDLTNSGGAWIGTWVGIRTPDGISRIHAVLRGAAQYKGLQARATYVTDPSIPSEFIIAGEIIQTAK